MEKREFLKTYAMDSVHSTIDQLNSEQIKRILDFLEGFLKNKQERFEISRIGFHNGLMNLDVTFGITFI